MSNVFLSKYNRISSVSKTAVATKRCHIYWWGSIESFIYYKLQKNTLRIRSIYSSNVEYLRAKNIEKVLRSPWYVILPFSSCYWLGITAEFNAADAGCFARVPHMSFLRTMSEGRYRWARAWGQLERDFVAARNLWLDSRNNTDAASDVSAVDTLWSIVKVKRLLYPWQPWARDRKVVRIVAICRNIAKNSLDGAGKNFFPLRKCSFVMHCKRCLIGLLQMFVSFLVPLQEKSMQIKKVGTIAAPVRGFREHCVALFNCSNL